MKWQATVTYGEIDQLLLGQMGTIIVANDVDAIFANLSKNWESEMRTGSVTVNLKRTDEVW